MHIDFSQHHKKDALIIQHEKLREVCSLLISSVEPEKPVSFQLVCMFSFISLSIFQSVPTKFFFTLYRRMMRHRRDDEVKSVKRVRTAALLLCCLPFHRCSCVFLYSTLCTVGNGCFFHNSSSSFHKTWRSEGKKFLTLSCMFFFKKKIS